MRIFATLLATLFIALLCNGCMGGATSEVEESVSVLYQGQIDLSDTANGAPAYSPKAYSGLKGIPVSLGPLHTVTAEDGSYAIEGKLPVRGFYALKCIVEGVEIARTIEVESNRHFFHKFSVNGENEAVVTETMLDNRAKKLTTLIESLNLETGTAQVVVNETNDGLTLVADDNVKEELLELIQEKMETAEEKGRGKGKWISGKKPGWRSDLVDPWNIAQ